MPAITTEVEPRLLAVWPTVGKALGVSRPTAYELVASGELRSVRIGRRVLVPVAELDRFIADRLDA